MYSFFFIFIFFIVSAYLTCMTEYQPTAGLTGGSPLVWRSANLKVRYSENEIRSSSPKRKQGPLVWKEKRVRLSENKKKSASPRGPLVRNGNTTSGLAVFMLF